MTGEDKPCPECGTLVSTELTDGLYLCRSCMKAVRIADDGDPDEKGDLFTDGGRGLVGEVERVEIPEDGTVVLTVRTTGGGLDIYEGHVGILGRLTLAEADSKRLINTLYNGPHLSECVYCGEDFPKEDAHEHHFREHTDRRFDPTWYFRGRGVTVSEGVDR